MILQVLCAGRDLEPADTGSDPKLFGEKELESCAGRRAAHNHVQLI
jgi:hypothetical protein